MSYARSIENAMALWNQQMANAQFTWTETPRTKAPSADGVTTISFESTIYGDAFGTDTLAATVIISSGARMTEADTMFNSRRWIFNSYFDSLSKNTAEDLHRIGLHELGHSLGLDHPDDAGQSVGAIMNSLVGNLNHLTPDDIAGVQSLYGARPGAPPPDGHGRLANISTRGQVGTGDSFLIGGFIVHDAAKNVLIRALGPSLPVAGRLTDPVLELHDGNGALIARNNNWKDTQQNAIAATTIPPTNDFESAIFATLSPGNFTAIVHGNAGLGGIALVEIYDLTPAQGRVANVSTRGRVSTGDNVMIGGFIVNGPQSKRIIVRGIGPSLSSAVVGALPDTTLELRNGNGVLMSSNTGWRNSSDSGEITATTLAPSSTAESAIVREVVPGNFTAILKSPSNSSGVGLIEVYDLDP